MCVSPERVDEQYVGTLEDIELALSTGATLREQLPLHKLSPQTHGLSLQSSVDVCNALSSFCSL